MGKLFIIGLDCAEPSLVFEEWKEDLPNLRYLSENGIYGKLKSTIPPITVPAWTSMLTGKDPGMLGIYGFRNRKPGSYELYIPNATHIKEKTSWEILSENGYKVILIGVPQTYPPKKINGIIVSSFLTPNKESDYTYPSEIKKELDEIADGDYIIDIKNFRTENKDWLLEEIYKMTERRFKVVKKFLREKPWDFFMFVEMGVDRIHHGFWRYMDKKHRLYEPGNPYENAIFDYYRYIDKKIGEILELLPKETTVIVVSDHGAKRMDGGIAINDYLIEAGYLRLKKKPQERKRLTPDDIDWRKTTAWAEGGYYSRVMINLKGREREGIVPEKDYKKILEKLKSEIESIPDERGRKLKTKALIPREIYKEVKNLPPDLIVYFDDLSWRGAGTVGNKTIHLFENDTGPDDANHSQYGMFIIHDRDLPKGKNLTLSIYDIAPSILGYFSLPIPSDIIGKNIFGEVEKVESMREKGKEIDYTEEEQKEISKRLEDLGYY